MVGSRERFEREVGRFESVVWAREGEGEGRAGQGRAG